MEYIKKQVMAYKQSPFNFYDKENGKKDPGGSKELDW